MNLIEMQKDILNLRKYLKNNYMKLSQEERLKKLYKLNMKLIHMEQMSAKKYFELRKK